MYKSTLHVIGIPHKVHTLENSHCAFSGKALRFSKMMQMQGYKVIEYANEGSDSTADEKVVILKKTEFNRLVKKSTGQYPQLHDIRNDLYIEFNKKLEKKMKPHVKKGDIVCHTFGVASMGIAQAYPDAFHVETGIGYPDCFSSFRIYESYAWWHYHLGKEQRGGGNYEFVIPNYYDVSEWESSDITGKYLLYFGRVIPEKGLDTVREISLHTNMLVVICGQGEQEYIDSLLKDRPNLIYRPPVTGLERSELLRNAYAMLMPTVYVEPFGGAGVEGQLCGTPLIASDYGCFSETVQPGINGFRCKTLQQWMDATEAVKDLDRGIISGLARERYSLETVGQQYDKSFSQILELTGSGWYSLKQKED